MKRAAIGIRAHSGWGALVAVANNGGMVEVLERRRVAVTIPGTPGANQPYHFAEKLKLAEAEKFLGNCFAASKRWLWRRYGTWSTNCVAANIAS
jgi:hypothetical protein